MRPRDLAEKLLKAMQECNSVATNAYVTLNTAKFERLKNALYQYKRDAWLPAVGNELLNLLSDNNALLDFEKTKNILTKIGEIDCYLLCKDKGINIKPNDKGKPKPGIKRADFVIDCSDGKLYLEVKTPGPAHSSQTVYKHFEQSLNSKIELQSQIDAGKQIAMTTQEIKFWQDGHSNHPNKYISHFIIDRVNSLYKSGQHLDDTLLVFNLMWSPYVVQPEDLLNCYASREPDFDKCDFGIVWMAAFGEPNVPAPSSKNMIIESEKMFDRQGFLKNPDNSNLKGVLFLSENTSGTGLKSHCVVRNFVLDKWVKGCYSDLIPKRQEIFNRLCGRSWNDELESNSDEIRKIVDASP